jgi:hypothetical protein
MKSLLGLFVVALVSISVSACGGASKGTGSTSHASSNAAATNGTTPATTPSTTTTTTSSSTTGSSTTTTGNHAKDSNDGDSDSSSNDDVEVLDYGHAANAADERTITALLKRYHAAAAAGDGATACSQIFSLMAEAIVEDYGELAGPANLRGKTCAIVLSKWFKLSHRKMVANAATLEVTGVRIKGKKGLALLRFGATGQPRYIPVRLEFGVWKIYSISDDSPLP